MRRQSATPATSLDRAGVFAPGHLGELTQIITPALVDQVLEATRRTQRRVRALPSRVMVYFVLAMALLGRGYRGVWSALTTGLGLATPDPSTSALSQARRRLGSAPLIALFDAVKGYAAGSDTLGAHWRGLRVVAWDGTLLEVADSRANAAFFGRHTARRGAAGFPCLRLSALVECGTRAVIDATYGPQREAERTQLTRLCSSLRPGTLLLADRGATGYDLLARAAATGAHLLWRVRADRFLPVLQTFADGSYLSLVCNPTNRRKLRTWVDQGGSGLPPVRGVLVRVVRAEITVATPVGVATRSPVLLITTLLDAQEFPARELAALYHQRWQVETAFYGLKVTLCGGGRVLRSTLPDGIVQELYGLLIVYHLARDLAARAATDAGIDPDQISLTVTVRSACDTVIAGVRPGCRCACTCTATADTALSTGDGESTVPARMRQAMLNPRDLGPKRRRPRISPRRVKRPVSKFAFNKTRNNKPLRKVVISYSITPPTAAGLTPAPTP